MSNVTSSAYFTALIVERHKITCILLQDCVKLTVCFRRWLGGAGYIAVSLRMRLCKAYPCAFDGGWVVQDTHSGVITHESV